MIYSLQRRLRILMIERRCISPKIVSLPGFHPQLTSHKTCDPNHDFVCFLLITTVIAFIITAAPETITSPLADNAHNASPRIITL